MAEQSGLNKGPSGQFVPSHGYQDAGGVGAPQRVRVDVQAFVPDPLPPALSDQEIGRLFVPVMQAKTLLMRLEGEIASLPSSRAFVGPMGRREVKYSSQIEHTYASVESVAVFDHEQRLLFPQDEGEKKKLLDRIEVWNNQQALEHGLSREQLPVCLRLIQEMHEKLMQFTGQHKRPGQFRNCQVFIGDEGLGISRARFIPPPPGPTMHCCLDALERFLHPRQFPRREIDILVDLAMAHYQFECIHPFDDGNGRLGRLIIPLWPYKSGAVRFPLPYVSKALADHREEYYDLLLGVSARGAWVDWIMFFARMVTTSCEEDLKRAARLGALYSHYYEKLTSSKRTTVQVVKLLDHVFGKLSVTSASVQNSLGVSQPTADEYIQRFEEAGLLREITGGNYRRRWFSDPVNQAISDDA